MDPLVYMKLVSIYLTSFYGSNLWDLYEDSAEKLYKSWNISIRYFFDIPRTTHRYLLESISGTSHLKQKLVKRFIQFYGTMSSCDKPHLKYLMYLQKSDYRSVFGRNVRNICKEAGAEEISEVSANDIRYATIPQDQEWRCVLIKELLELRAGRLTTELSDKEITKILDSVTSD